jgi:hypothetical protein
LEKLSQLSKLTQQVRKSECKWLNLAGDWWLPPVILATQEAEIRGNHGSKPDRANSLRDPIWKNPSQKIGLMEWLKV